MEIRRETESDFEAIYELVRMAFLTAKVSNGKEQDYVLRLRAGGNYIPELALVAEEAGALIGHIMLTRTYIMEGAGRRETLLLAPLSVALEWRGRGIGARLMEEAFAAAVKLGHGSVVLVGDPAYYGRFGFKSSRDFGIGNAHGVPDQYVLALELRPGALQGVSGAITWQD